MRRELADVMSAHDKACAVGACYIRAMTPFSCVTSRLPEFGTRAEQDRRVGTVIKGLP